MTPGKLCKNFFHLYTIHFKDIPHPDDFKLPLICIFKDAQTPETSPYLAVYCIIYFVACALGIGYAFYLYFKHMIRRYILRNGYETYKSNSGRKRSNKESVPGLLRSGHDAEMQTISLRDGGQLGSIEGKGEVRVVQLYINQSINL